MAGSAGVGTNNFTKSVNFDEIQTALIPFMVQWRNLDGLIWLSQPCHLAGEYHRKFKNKNRKTLIRKLANDHNIPLIHLHL